jgi:hypothetical protein
MSEIKVNKVSPRSGTDITLGNSGTDFIVPSGATITVNSGGQIVNNGIMERQRDLVYLGNQFKQQVLQLQ